ncbi:hypothetical protein GCM10027594_06740 [Hymenobacter agri]|uniref:Uncharacterized protein n=1 Tax=Hymenobacter jeollabukensis TaxID=2025313 RepID=A0A5R8WI58_9BACT|nr:hypothetical protein [Hymenobacter jeollabukensis]TLM88458.1 hypothetical protein FDY95_24155 [Hymenobacter jeollabukensis]
MPTEYYGGDGPPSRTVGHFEVKYTVTLPDGQRTNQQQSFTEYGKAEEFYAGLDDSAFLWDQTGMPELCAGKTRIAYYSGLLWKGRENHNGAVRRTVAVKTDEAESAAQLLNYISKQLGLKLDLASIREVDAAGYEQYRIKTE